MPEDHWFIYEKPQSPFVVPQPEPGFQLGDPHDYPKPPKSEPPPPPPAPPAKPPVKPPAPPVRDEARGHENAAAQGDETAGAREQAGDTACSLPAPAASALLEPPGLKRNPESGTRNPVPLWQSISGGLGTDDEAAFSRTERRAALRKLIKFAEDEMRAEMLAAEEEAEKEEHTFLWDPVPAVCVKLGISRMRLTLYSKEFSGMSASQMADRIRAEKLKAKMRENLSAFIRRRHTAGKKNLADRPLSANEMCWKFWDELKSYRRCPWFSRAAWAIENGFANYTRFYRACLLRWGKTPSQLEWEMLEEIAEYYAAAEDLETRRHAVENPENWKWDKWREKPYKDAWAEALREKPEWLAKMRTEFGLLDTLCSFANE